MSGGPRRQSSGSADASSVVVASAMSVVKWPRSETVKANLFDMLSGRFTGIEYLGQEKSFSRQQLVEMERKLQRVMQLFVVQGAGSSGGRTAWDECLERFKFQEDSLFNQYEDVCHTLLGMILRDEGAGTGGDVSQVVSKSGFKSLEEHCLYRYHRRLFKNYRRWARFIKVKPFGWDVIASVEPTSRPLQMAREVALWKLIWGESANLRHCPEMICCLFHWFVTSWGRVDTANLPSYLETITPVISLFWDEMNRPFGDHPVKLNYDDFNELFWQGDRLHAHFFKTHVWDGNLFGYIQQWTCNPSFMSGEANHGKKTFVEHRHYLNFFRTWWRVYEWHVLVLVLLLWLNTIMRPESQVSSARSDVYWGMGIMIATGAGAFAVFLDILFTWLSPTPMLSRLRELCRQTTHWYWISQQLLSGIKVGFFAAAVRAYVTGGATAPALKCDGCVGGLFLLWWGLQGLRLLLLRPIRHLAGGCCRRGPSWQNVGSFVGNPFLLVQEYRHLISYAAFWLPIVAIKVGVSFIVYCYGFVDLIEFIGHPDSTITYHTLGYEIEDTTSWSALITLGFPGLIVFFFDIMFFYAIYLAVWSWGVGFFRGIGYVTELDQARKVFWLLPLQFDRTLSQDAGGFINKRGKQWSILGYMTCGFCSRRDRSQTKPASYFLKHSRPLYAKPTLKPGHFKAASIVNAPDTCGSITTSVTPTERVMQGRERSPPSSHTGQMKPGVSPRMLEEGEPATEGNAAASPTPTTVTAAAKQRRAMPQHPPGWWSRELLGGPQSTCKIPAEVVEHQLRRFAFIWNEVVESWREEDIIDNGERLKLQFNELPAIQFTDLQHIWSGEACVEWDASECRLPVWLYSDIFPTFFRECELFHQKVADIWSVQRDHHRRHSFRSQYLLETLPVSAAEAVCGGTSGAGARHNFRKAGTEFYEKLLGSFKGERGEMQHVLRLGLLEVFESLSFYIARYYTNGPSLVKAVSALCQRVGSDPFFLSFLDLTALKNINEALANALQSAQDDSSTDSDLGLDPKLMDFNRKLLRTLGTIVLPALLESTGKQVLESDLFEQSFPELPAFLHALSDCAPATHLSYANGYTGNATMTAAVGRNAFATGAEASGAPGTGKDLSPERVDEKGLKIRPAGAAWEGDVEKSFPFDLTDDVNPFVVNLDDCLRLFYRRACRVLRAQSYKPKTALAQMRLKSFASSLFMEIPEAPSVMRMVSMSTLTPYYQEDAMLDDRDLHSKSQEGVTKIEFLRALYPTDWQNFLERVDPQGVLFECYQKEEETLMSLKGQALQQQLQQDPVARKNLHNERMLSRLMRDEMEQWASMRSQTLCRTIRGVMYYEQALQVLAWLELQEVKGNRYHLSRDRNVLTFEQEKKLNWQAVPVPPDSPRRLSIFTDMYNRWVNRNQKKPYSLDPASQAIATLRFQYVVTAQTLGDDIKNATANRAAALRVRALTELLQRYPGLRAACVESCEMPGTRRPVKCSTLFKWDEEQQRLVRVYRVVLGLLEGPAHKRNPIVGEGKAENQNHAVIFTRGETLQAIDMNQELHLEEAFKLRNLLQEFARDQKIGIVGFREPPMGSSATTCSWTANWNPFTFCVFETRAFHMPLRVRLHYGHPDVIDRFLIQTMGGESKASSIICVSEDVYCGLNVIQRGYSISQVDYIEAVKGWPNDLDQLVAFFRKCGAGSAEAQSFSRDSNRLAKNVDFFYLLSLWAAWPGWHIANILVLFSVWTYLYARILLGSLTVTTSDAMNEVLVNWDSKQWSMMDHISLGLFVFFYVKFFAMIAVEEGIARGWQHLLYHIKSLSILHFTFTIGTWTTAFDDTMLYGRAKYQNAGRGLQIAHKDFRHIWQMYFYSHWQPAVELLLLLIFYSGGQSFLPVNAARTWFFWIVAISWLYMPFLYNPLGFAWSRLVEDLRLWQRWMISQGVTDPQESWWGWWRLQMNGRCKALRQNRLIILVRNMRFLLLALCIFTATAFRRDMYLFNQLAPPIVMTGCLLMGLMLAARGEHTRFTLTYGTWPTAFARVMPLLRFIGWIVTGTLFAAVLFTMEVTFGELLGGLAAVLMVLWTLAHSAVETVGYFEGWIDFTMQPMIVETVRLCHLTLGYAIFMPLFALAALKYFLNASEWQTNYMWHTNVTSTIKTSQIEMANLVRKGTISTLVKGHYERFGRLEETSP
ncbi:unnamed protein product [Vitrella brassicaformis CCMP3155]|uniref:1,3-beta-glucan synthase n=5 Tax=Vitrella brassicaformis TaxID=1169539 RepID=A0A0G4FSV3_VITBC|nr:unnamed protein product [Vitrella brassicaformis CCMP3155]|eukprot:CEM17389.1 unnamed protein product [Vitrella brassicaformis CCMP3155]